MLASSAFQDDNLNPNVFWEVCQEKKSNFCVFVLVFFCVVLFQEKTPIFQPDRQSIIGGEIKSFCTNFWVNTKSVIFSGWIVIVRIPGNI